ncbi:MAG TPA: EamA family transporter [Candidatus Dormibacteraeota bacterium]|nr:EamA family transporter [Candidatus Dormibacteraeota bacterium]
MTWQFFLICFLLLGTVVALLQRRLGQVIPEHNQLVNGFFFLGIHYPLALVIASIAGFHLNVGWFNAIVMIVVATTFPLTNILAFRASKDVDAGLFGILNNLGPVLTIGLAAILLSERLTPHQFAGALIIVFSALFVSIVTYDRGSRSTRTGIMLALLSVVLLGADTVYETWMLSRLGYGTYLVYGVGLQTFWMTVFAWPYRKHIKQVINRRYGPEVLALSLSKSLKGMAFVAALYLSKNAAIVGAFTGFLPVMVVLAAYVFLREKQWLRVKVVAAAMGTVGLVILAGR